MLEIGSIRTAAGPGAWRTVYAACQARDRPQRHLQVLSRLREAGASADAVTPFPTRKPEIDALVGRYRTG